MSSLERFNLATYFVDRHLEDGRGERTALIRGETGVQTSYAELARLTNRIGHVLRDQGLEAGDRVLIVLPDGVEFVATWYAVSKVAGVTAEVYTFLAPKDYAYYLRYTRPRVTVVHASVLDRFREAVRILAEAGEPPPRTLVVAGTTTLQGGEESFDALVAQAPDVLDPAPTRRGDIALWKFTTGSTGEPKACVHRMETPLLSYECYARGVLDIRPDDVVLPVPKLFFGYARDLTALYPFGVGGAGIVFPERTTPERIFALAAQHQPTILVNVPTMMRAMIASPLAGTQDLGCLRLATSAGEPLPPALYHRWYERFGVEVLDGIGSSEAYHIYLSSRLGEVRPGSVGKEVPGYRARIVDEQGQALADGETGRLWVNAPTAAVEYFGAAEKSESTFAGDLVMTGDLFERDADGYYHYRGRADELLKVGGIWVAPAEIEQALATHDDVAECAVVGYEEEGLARPRAYVVLASRRAGNAELERELKAHVRARLSPHKYPRDIRFVDELPKTGSGKIDRRALREDST